MQRPVQIRRYRTGEEPEIWEVFFRTTHESNARDYHPDLIDRWAPLDKDMTEWSERLKTANPFVAVVDGEIVGMAELDENGLVRMNRLTGTCPSTILLCLQYWSRT